MSMCLCTNSCPKWAPDGSAVTAPTHQHPLGAPPLLPLVAGSASHMPLKTRTERGNPWCSNDLLPATPPPPFPLGPPSRTLCPPFSFTPALGGAGRAGRAQGFQAPIQRGCQCIRGSGIPIQFHLFMTSWLRLPKIWFFLFNTGLTNRTDLQGL